jgi:hypothetical protein
MTPKQAKNMLALPVYALLTGKAHPEFTGGNLASPSKLVVIRANNGGCAKSPLGKGLGLPCTLNGKQWNTAVRPILEDPLWDSANPIFAAVSTSNWSYMLETLGNAIAQSFSDAGYGPINC